MGVCLLLSLHIDHVLMATDQSDHSAKEETIEGQSVHSITKSTGGKVIMYIL